MRRSMVLVFIAALDVASPLSAATISGTISDTTGGALKAARVTLRAIATGEETVVDTDEQGRYRFDDAMHFQFAPARGRGFTVGLNVGAF